MSTQRKWNRIPMPRASTLSKIVAASVILLAHPYEGATSAEVDGTLRALAYLTSVESSPAIELCFENPPQLHIPPKSVVEIGVKRFTIGDSIALLPQISPTLTLESSPELLLVLAGHPDSVLPGSITAVLEPVDAPPIKCEISWVGWRGAIQDLSARSANQSRSIPTASSADGEWLAHQMTSEGVVWEGPATARLLPVRGGFRIERDLVVPRGDTLVISAGCQLFFGPAAGVKVYGTIRAIGSYDAPIRFDALDSINGWKNISILEDSLNAPSAATTCIFRYCVFRQGRGIRFKGDKNNYHSISIDEESARNLCGGAILVSNRWVDVENSAFVNNRAGQGGALFLRLGYDRYVTGNLFLGNLSRSVSGEYPGGGAIRCFGVVDAKTHTTILGNSFVNNSVSDSAYPYGCGGAVYTGDWCGVNLERNLFLNNTADNAGAALYAAHEHKTTDGNLLTLRVLKNVFNGNSATSGYAVRVDHLVTLNTLRDNVFAHNHVRAGVSQVSDRGGSLTFDEQSRISLIHNWFLNNATESGVSGVLIGKVGGENAELIEVEDNSLRFNRSSNGEAMRIDLLDNVDKNIKSRLRLKLGRKNDFSSNSPSGLEVEGGQQTVSPISEIIEDAAHQLLTWIVRVLLLALVLAAFVLTFPPFVILLAAASVVLPGARSIVKAFLMSAAFRRRLFSPYVKPLARELGQPTEIPDPLAETIKYQLRQLKGVVIASCGTDVWRYRDRVIQYLIQFRSVEFVPIRISAVDSFSSMSIVSASRRSMEDVAKSVNSSAAMRLIRNKHAFEVILECICEIGAAYFVYCDSTVSPQDLEMQNHTIEQWMRELLEASIVVLRNRSLVFSSAEDSPKIRGAMIVELQP